MMRTLLWLAAGLVALLSGAAAKPITFFVDRELAGAALVLEATVLSAREGFPVQLRASPDPERIWRGADLVGRGFDARVWQGGVHAGTAVLAKEQGKSLLFVIDPKKEIRLVATRTGAGYHFSGFYDFNAVWLRAEKNGFGRQVGGMPDMRYEVSLREMEEAFVQEREVLGRCAAVLLLQTAEDRSAERVARLIEWLGSSRFAEREAAQAALAEVAAFHELSLKKQAAAATDLEVRARLERLLERLGPWKAVRAVVEKAAADRAFQVRLLRAGMPRLDPARRQKAEARIKELEASPAVR